VNGGCVHKYLFGVGSRHTAGKSEACRAPASEAKSWAYFLPSLPSDFVPINRDYVGRSPKPSLTSGALA